MPLPDGKPGVGSKTVVNKSVIVKKAPPNSHQILFSTLKAIDAPLELNIDRDVFIQMIGWFLENPGDEIAGVAVHKDGQIVWSSMASIIKQDHGSVTSDSGEATVQAVLAGHGAPNIQWHTHPGFGEFFSGTDITDQMRFVNDAAKINMDGSYTFLVFDQLSWSIRRIVWKDGKPISTQDGIVKINDISLKFRKHIYSYKSYGKWQKSGLATVPGKKWAPQEPLAPIEDDYFFAGSVDDLLKGHWSEKDSDYDFLFDFFEIEKYEWQTLYDCIGETYGYGEYYTIVDYKDLWPDLKELLHGQQHQIIETGEPYSESTFGL